MEADADGGVGDFVDPGVCGWEGAVGVVRVSLSGRSLRFRPGCDLPGLNIC